MAGLEMDQLNMSILYVNGEKLLQVLHEFEFSDLNIKLEYLVEENI